MYWILIVLAVLIWLSLPWLKVRLCKSYIKQTLAKLPADDHVVLHNAIIQKGKPAQTDVVVSPGAVFILVHHPLRSARVVSEEHLQASRALAQECAGEVQKSLAGHLKDWHVPCVPLVLLYPKPAKVQVDDRHSVAVLLPRRLEETILSRRIHDQGALPVEQVADSLRNQLKQ